MADAPNTSFDNLTHSGLLKITSKDNKEVTLQFDVWGGNTSLVIFTPGGGRPWKIPLPRKLQSLIVTLIRKIKANPGTTREPIIIKEFVEENGKKMFKEKGQIGIGVDENLVPYIDVAANDLSGRHQFLFKSDARYDVLQSSLTDKDVLQSLLNVFLTLFETDIPVAERMSSFKRPAGGGRGGYSGGGGGNRGSYNNNNSGGGGGNSYNNNNNQSRQQGGTFSGGDEELHV